MSEPSATSATVDETGRQVRTGGIVRTGALAGLFSLRVVGRVVPLGIVWVLIWPLAMILAIRDYDRIRSRKGRLAALAAISRQDGTKVGFWRFLLERSNCRLTRLLFLWPERYISPRFSRCQFEGVDQLVQLDAGDRPVILATLHYGPMSMLLEFLRARHYPVAAVAFIGYGQRPWLRRYLGKIGDRLAGMGSVAPVIEVGHVMAMREHLEKNRVLLLAVENGGSGGRHATVQTTGDLGLSMISSVFKLADITGAKVIPCLIRARPFFSFSIQFGQTVPDGDVTDRRRHPAACQHLLQQFAPMLAQSPGQSTSLLLDAIEPAAQTSAPREYPSGQRPRRQVA